MLYDWGKRLKTKEMKSKGKLEQALLQFQFLLFYLQGFFFFFASKAFKQAVNTILWDAISKPLQSRL